VDKFQSEIGIPNVCKSNSNWNYKTEVQKFVFRLRSLVKTEITVVTIVSGTENNHSEPETCNDVLYQA